MQEGESVTQTTAPDVEESNQTPTHANGPISALEDLESISEWDDIELQARSRRGWLSGGRGLLLGMGLGVAVAVVGGRVVSGPPSRAEVEPVAPVVEVAAASALTVSVDEVRFSSIPQTLSVTGTVRAVDLLQVAPQVSGLQVREILVREGEQVRRGQVLALLDDSVLQAEIVQAQAQLEAAKASVKQRQAELAQDEASLAEAEEQLRRYETLAAEGAISQEALTARRTAALTAREAIGVAQANISSAEADVRSQEANVVRLRTQLQQTKVLAPASGAIADKIARIGDVSAGSQPMFALIRNNQLELQAEVPQAQLELVRMGAPVRITSSTDRRIQFEGRIRDIDPVVDSQSRVATVNVDLPPSGLLRPGMFLQGDVNIAVDDGLTVPAKAVVPHGNGQFQVYLLAADNVVEVRPVQVGARLPSELNGVATERVQILSGLAPGDRVVTSGASYLNDGDRVEVAPAL